MRLFLLVGVVFLVLALICLLVPTVVLSAGWPTWLVSGLLAWALDQLLGGYVLPINRQPTQ